MDYLTDLFTGGRRSRKEVNSSAKESSPPPPESIPGNSSWPSQDNVNPTRPSAVPSTVNSCPTLVYLQAEFAVLTRSLSESNINELIRQPTGVDRNEWIANNIVAFYNHVNSLNNALSELCTPVSCPEMIGPQKSLYYWFDERNKKVKCSAPQYIDLSLIFIQKSLDDETIFPTRLDHQFPVYFDGLVRRIVRLLYHIVAHFYAAHYQQIVELQLNPHLNSFFLHFVSFLITSKIISTEGPNVNTSSTGSTSSTLGSTDGRELRSELESLEVLYRLLSDQWRRFYQMSMQKRRTAKAE